MVMSMAKYGEPAVHAAPIKENRAEAARAFLRPIQSANHPCAIEPRAAPKAKRALTAPSTLEIHHQPGSSTPQGVLQRTRRT